jgi:hypothetical protein
MQEIESFELIYEGSTDSSPETLRKIKATFIAELNLEIDEVMDILSHTPSVIFEAENEELLRNELFKLQQAGALVRILKKGSGIANNTSSTDIPIESKKPSTTLSNSNPSAMDVEHLYSEIEASEYTTEDLEEDDMTGEVDEEQIPEEDSEFEFTFSFDEVEDKAPLKVQKNQKVWALEIEDEEHCSQEDDNESFISSPEDEEHAEHEAYQLSVTNVDDEVSAFLSTLGIEEGETQSGENLSKARDQDKNIITTESVHYSQISEDDLLTSALHIEGESLESLKPLNENSQREDTTSINSKNSQLQLSLVEDDDAPLFNNLKREPLQETKEEAEQAYASEFDLKISLEDDPNTHISLSNISDDISKDASVLLSEGIEEYIKNDFDTLSLVGDEDQEEAESTHQSTYAIETAEEEIDLTISIDEPHDTLTPSAEVLTPNTPSSEDKKVLLTTPHKKNSEQETSQINATKKIHHLKALKKNDRPVFEENGEPKLSEDISSVEHIQSNTLAKTATHVPKNEHSLAKTESQKTNSLITPEKKRAVLQSGFIFLLCGMLLVVANIIYFTSTEASNRVKGLSFDIFNPKLLFQSNNDATTKKDEIVKPVRLLIQDAETKGIKGECSLTKETLNECTLTIELSVKEYTAEEIVKGEDRKPILRKIEVEHVTFVNKNPGTFLGDGLAKIYIDVNKERTRIVGQVAIDSRVSSDNKTLFSNFKIYFGNIASIYPPKDTLPNISYNFITKDKDGKFIVDFRDSFSARAQ